MQKANYYRLLWFTLAVLVAGYLLIHLFAMPAFTLGPRSPHDVRLNLCVWEPQLSQAFSSDMIIMGLVFPLMRGAAGLALGICLRAQQSRA